MFRFLFFAVTSFVSLACLHAQGIRSVADRPNVIVVMADDVSWEAFGCYGAKEYQTPHLDSLAAEGIRFTHCYSTPICTPSRVKLMTGKYNFRNYTHFGYLNPEEKTFGQLLQQAGYKTVIAGKWQLNGLYNSLAGSGDGGRPMQAGFDEALLWQVTKGKSPREGGGERFWSPPLEKNGQLQTIEQNAGKYGPDLMCDFLCDFMQRHRDEPFFVYYPMVLVHDPFVKTPDTIGDAVRDQSANKAPKSQQARKNNFVAMVQYMDKLVGRLVAKVDKLGLSENTIILFTADNGTNTSITSQWNGKAIKGGKGGMTDMGTHVPLIASWKGTSPNGKVLDDLIEFTDFYPTLAEAAGIELGGNDPIDGRSFLPQLRGKPGNPREWVLCHYEPYWNKQPGQFARTQHFKLYRDGRFFQVPEDLEELNSIAVGQGGVEVERARQLLLRLLEQCPPVPAESGNRNTVRRPVYPEWGGLLSP